MQKKIVSFDIFDTLVTRTVIEPHTIFRIMQSRLCRDTIYSSISTLLRHNFSLIRINTEKFASENLRINKNKTVVSFDDIYEYIRINYALTDEQVTILKKLELSIEKNNIVPIQENIKKLKTYKEKGYEIILISDMYLSQELIRMFLVSFDDIFKDIKIYVSNEYNATKRSGKLYKIIKNEYNDIKEWIHYGDSLIGDFIQARLNGLQSKYIKHPPLLPHEKFLIKNFKNNFKIETIIGCARALRYAKTGDKYIYGTSFAAPILYNYVKWVLEQCSILNIKNIYFVARDGYILKQIADIIIEKSSYKFNTHYFYSSRIAARIVSEESYEDYIKCILREKYTNKSTSKILSSLNLSLEDLQKIIDVSSRLRKEILIDMLHNNKALMSTIVEKNKAKNKMFEAYLNQELDESDSKIAFVDISGTGRTQDILAQVWNKEHKCCIYNFYLLNNISLKQKENSIKCSYFSSPEHTTVWAELLSRSPDAQTIGYKQDENNKIVPQKEYEENPYIIRWGFNDYLAGILDYTKLMLICETKNDICTNELEYYPAISTYIQKYLDNRAANVFGSVPFSDYGLEKNGKEIAPKITLKSLFVYNHFDYISIARCNRFIKPFVVFIKKLVSPTTYGTISSERQLAYIKFFKLKIDISHLIWKKHKKNKLKEIIIGEDKC